MDLGLERIQKLLSILGNPQDQLKVIHVAGTNGKGSVCAYTASVLRQLHLTVGRFNSPHLIEPQDSIYINDGPVGKEEYDRTLLYVERVNNDQQLFASSFERLVATSLLIFVNHKLDWVVMEVGLGGTLDATNVFKHPKMTIITAIGWDHATILGGSMESIAQAKAGIIKPRCPVVLAPQDESDVLNTLVQQAMKLNAPFKLVKEAEQRKEEGEYRLELDEHIYDYSVPLRGDYQRANSATAITGLIWLRDLGDIQFTDKQLQEGIAKTYWPGRLEQIPSTILKGGQKLPSILVDGAHNAPATRALRKYIDDTIDSKQQQSIIWIVGVTTGKDIKEMLQILLRPKDSIFAVPFSQPVGMPWIESVSPQEIKDIADKLLVKEVKTFGNIKSCLQALPNDDLNYKVVICGSLYLVADFYRFLNENKK
ncbi:Mur ligase [Circinella umbellata]|nr:Mur ligase [Circinella umbellata]